MQKKNSWDKVTLTKIGKSALLVIAGTILTFLSAHLVEILTAVNIPANTQIVMVGVITWLINTAREYCKGN